MCREKEGDMHVLTSTEIHLTNGESGKCPLENRNIEWYFITYIHGQIHTLYMPTYTDKIVPVLN